MDVNGAASTLSFQSESETAARSQVSNAPHAASAVNAAPADRAGKSTEEAESDARTRPRMLPSEKMKVSKFIVSSYNMVSDVQNERAIGFNQSGTAIELRDLDMLSHEVLPRYFRHNQIASFSRQLNNYEFEMRISRAGVAQTFAHPYFVRGREDLLPHLRRRSARPRFTRTQMPSSEDSEPPEPQLDQIKASEKDKVGRFRALEAQNQQIIRYNMSLREENARLRAMLESAMYAASAASASSSAAVEATSNRGRENPTDLAPFWQSPMFAYRQLDSPMRGTNSPPVGPSPLGGSKRLRPAQEQEMMSERQRIQTGGARPAYSMPAGGRGGHATISPADWTQHFDYHAAWAALSASPTVPTERLGNPSVDNSVAHSTNQTWQQQPQQRPSQANLLFPPVLGDTSHVSGHRQSGQMYEMMSDKAGNLLSPLDPQQSFFRFDSEGSSSSSSGAAALKPARESDGLRRRA